MNYEQEFEILAVLCPITPREHLAAARAIVDCRLARIDKDIEDHSKGVFSMDPDPRMGELIMRGLAAERQDIEEKWCEIDGRFANSEEEQSRRKPGRPKGSKTKPKPGSIVVDTLAANSVTNEVQHDRSSEVAR